MRQVFRSAGDRGGAQPPKTDSDSSDPALSYTPRGFYQRRGKRMIDLCAAVVGLVLLSPFLLLVAIAIKIDSPGPVFYRSRRLRQHAKVFDFIKFRTMDVNAEQKKAELEHLNEMTGPVFKIQNDPRVTRVGRLLRRTSLDELPQLFHVLRGEMGLVGPRPPIPEEVEHYERWQRRRLSVVPGITCLWQVSGRNQIQFEEWMRLDMEYIDNISLRLDLKVLLKTVPAVVRRTGAS